jgi:hypothetical protein
VTRRNRSALVPVVPPSTSGRSYIVSILWIILIVVLVLVLVGALGRGRF